jgi:predicted RNA-binding Zn ribbon-like protein
MIQHGAWLGITGLLSLTSYWTPSRCERRRDALGTLIVLTKSAPQFIGGRLSIDFANSQPSSDHLSWKNLLEFLLATRIISPERSAQLLVLPQTDARSADALLLKASRLRRCLRQIFAALVRKEPISLDRVNPVNEILRITEGHEELFPQDAVWRFEFVAREETLDWLLAAIARSAAEILAEGRQARLHVCANPTCGLFFYDTSRTGRRRWCSMARCGNRHKVAAFARRNPSRRREL